jgi:hypothetical protein
MPQRLWVSVISSSALVLAGCGSLTSTASQASQPVTGAEVVTTESGTIASGEPTTILIGEPPPLSGIAADIGTRAGDAMRSFDPFSDPIRITLRADQRELAQQFVDQYGAKVAVRLGGFPFPNADDPRDGSPSPTCGDVPVTSGDATLEMSLDSPPLTSISGADLSVAISIKNASAQPFGWFSGGVDTAYVTDSGSRRVVGFSDIGMTAEGHSGTVEAGGTLQRGALGGTSSCDKARGWALPPGNYDVYVVFNTLAVDGAKGGNYVSPPFPLVITNEKPKLPNPKDLPAITPPPETGNAQPTTTMPTPPTLNPPAPVIDGPPATVPPVTATSDSSDSSPV